MAGDPRNLIPYHFHPGQSGNPKGSRKGKRFRTIAREIGQYEAPDFILEKLYAAMKRNGESVTEFNGGEVTIDYVYALYLHYKRFESPAWAALYFKHVEGNAAPEPPEPPQEEKPPVPKVVLADPGGLIDDDDDEEEEEIEPEEEGLQPEAAGGV